MLPDAVLLFVLIVLLACSEPLNDASPPSMTRLRGRVPDPGWRSSRSTSCIAFLLTIAAWRAPATTYIGEGPDPVQAMWGIGWVPYAASHGLNPLVSHVRESHRPGSNMLWGNAFAIPMGALLWPVTVAVGATVSYDLVITLSLALASFFAFLAIRRWVPGVVAAAAGRSALRVLAVHDRASTSVISAWCMSGVTPPLALLLAGRDRGAPASPPAASLGLLAAGARRPAVLHHAGVAAHRGDRRAPSWSSCSRSRIATLVRAHAGFVGAHAVHRGRDIGGGARVSRHGCSSSHRDHAGDARRACTAPIPTSPIAANFIVPTVAQLIIAAGSDQHLVAFQRQRVGVGRVPGDPAHPDAGGGNGSFLAGAGDTDCGHRRA